VREAVRLLEEQHERRQAELEHARSLILEGAEQLDRGEFVDGETFFREWDEQIEVAARRATE